MPPRARPSPPAHPRSGRAPRGRVRCCQPYRAHRRRPENPAIRHHRAAGCRSMLKHHSCIPCPEHTVRLGRSVPLANRACSTRRGREKRREGRSTELAACRLLRSSSHERGVCSSRRDQRVDHKQKTRLPDGNRASCGRAGNAGGALRLCTHALHTPCHTRLSRK